MNADGRHVRHEIHPDDTSRVLLADAESRVSATFVATDSTGLRSLSPGITIQYTVGVGVERRHMSLDPVRADCPRARLEHTEEIRGTGESRTILLTAAAEGWDGLRAAIDPITVRFE